MAPRLDAPIATHGVVRGHVVTQPGCCLIGQRKPGRSADAEAVVCPPALRRDKEAGSGVTLVGR